jgi:hypothetical protein
MDGDIGRVVGKLEAISEELTDLAMNRLREAMAAGETEVPLDEKRINRARRAVERAAAILRSADEGGSGEDG